MADSKLLKNTILYSVGEVLPRIISFLLLPVYTRFLSPEDYGIISYTQTIIVFLFVLGAFGLNTYTLRFYFVYDKEEERRRLLGTVQLVIIGLNMLILVLAFLLMPVIIERNQIQVPWNPYFKLAFVINFFECFSIIPMVVYRVRQDATKFVILGLSRTFLTVVLTLLFVVFQNRGVLGTYQAQLYVLLPYSLVYLCIMKKYSKLAIDWNYIKEGVYYAAPLIPGAICYQLLSVSDRVILERNVGIGELGIYNVACQIALALNIIIQSGYKAIEPELFRRFGKEGFYDFMKRTQSVFFFAIYVVAFAICLFSQEVFLLMTSEGFHEGYYLVPALIVGVIMTGQNVIYSGILHGEKRTKTAGMATVIGASVSITINIIFIPLFGTIAAAIASALSFFVMNVFLFHFMTFPGKTMVRETILVLLVPSLSYLLFYLLKEVSVLGVFMKLIFLCLYTVLAMRLLSIDYENVRKLLLNKRT